MFPKANASSCGEIHFLIYFPFFKQISRSQHNILKEKVYQKLFANQPIMFISRTSQPPYQKLCELVQLCGGKVCKTLRQAKICIGQCKVGKYVDMQCLSEKWIIGKRSHFYFIKYNLYVF